MAFLKYLFKILCIAFLIFAPIVFLFNFFSKPPSLFAAVNTNTRTFFFGSNAHFELYSTDVKAAAITSATVAHFNMLRGGDIFAHIAPTSSDTATWNWSEEDAFVTQTTSNGITPLVNLSYNVPWLSADTKNPNETLANKNEFIKAFGDYSYEVANRYKPGNANNFPVVTYFNIWNEPSLSQFFGWGPDEFARVFAEASYRVKQANPNAVVGFDVHAIDHMYSYNITAENQTGSTFMPRVLSKSVALQYNGQIISVIDYVDLLESHSYPDRTSDIPEDLLGQHKEISSAFTDIDAYLTHTYQNTTGQKYGYGPTRGAKRYMLTENGWFACPTGTPSGSYVSEPKQAALVIRSLLNVLSNPLVEGYLQYDMKDDGTGTGCTNTNGESENFYGLTRYNLVNGALDPKPVFTAYKTAIEIIDNTNFLSKNITTIDADQKIFNYKFISADTTKTVSALVRANALTPLGVLNTTSSPVTIPVNPTATVKKVSLYGIETPLAVTDGFVTLAVTEEPVFVVESTTEPVSTPTPTVTPTPDSPTNTPTPGPTFTPTPTVPPSPFFVDIYVPNDNLTVYAANASGFNMKSTASYYSVTVNGMKVFLDGVVKKSCLYSTFSCDAYISFAGIANGSHTLRVEAYKTGVAPDGVDQLTICKGQCDTTPLPTNTPILTATPTLTPTPVPSYALTGAVYIDTNGNGAQDIGEGGYNGATVAVTGATSATTITDTTGYYTFAPLVSGNYSVTLSIPTGYQLTTVNPVSIGLIMNSSVNFGINVAPTPTSTPIPTATPTQVPSAITTSIYAPASGTVYNSGASINIKTNAYYNGTSVNNIQIFVDGVVRKTCAYTTTTCDGSVLSSSLSIGQHTISVEARKTGVAGVGTNSIMIIRQ